MIRRRTQAVYVISVAAELAGMHPQTLRIYERRGLVQPARTQGGNRRYSDADIEVLRRISELAESGMNLEGIRRVMELEAENERLEAELAEARSHGRAGRRPKRRATRARARAAAPGARRVRRTPGFLRDRADGRAPQRAGSATSTCQAAADDDVRWIEGHARAVDEVVVARGVEHDEVGARAGAEPADVVAPQRPGPAERRRPHRLGGGHPQVAHGEGDDERHRRRVARPGLQLVARATVAPASITRRASGYGWRVEKSVAGRNVATVSLAGQRVDVVVGQVRAVVGRGAPQLDGELHARAGPELVGVQPQAEPGGPPGLQHVPALVGVERAALAERVDPAGVRRGGGEHLAGRRAST